MSMNSLQIRVCLVGFIFLVITTLHALHRPVFYSDSLIRSYIAIVLCFGASFWLAGRKSTK
jgi:hypothetical protein